MKKLTFLFLVNLIWIVSYAKKDSIHNEQIELINRSNFTDSITIKTTKEIKKFGFITNIPDDLWKVTKSPFEKENFKGLSLVVGTTAFFLWQDQNLANEAQQFGRNINLSPETSYSVPLSFGNTRLIKIPKNLNTAVYQLGEGGTSMYIAGGLFIYGKINHDKRAVQTASDLTESFISTGITTQVLKRISGRQTPSSSTQNGGKWQPFPSFGDFKDNIDNFDSFPSGHLTTMMATVTVLSQNYPEKKWIKPVGYSLIAMTGFAMMNNGVHWIGDYPLAIALGYVSGKITVDRHKQISKSKVIH